MSDANSYLVTTTGTQTRKEYSHQGRPIDVYFDTTPMLYIAIFSQEYDGAPDSHHAMGMGRTEEEAVADLIDNDELLYGDR